MTGNKIIFWSLFLRKRRGNVEEVEKIEEEGGPIIKGNFRNMHFSCVISNCVLSGL